MLLLRKSGASWSKRRFALTPACLRRSGSARNAWSPLTATGTACPVPTPIKASSAGCMPVRFVVMPTVDRSPSIHAFSGGTKPFATPYITSPCWSANPVPCAMAVPSATGRWLDNVFIECLWRSLKYENVYQYAYETGSQARAGIGGWMNFYNQIRPHNSLGGITPNMCDEQDFMKAASYRLEDFPGSRPGYLPAIRHERRLCFCQSLTTV